MVKRMYRCTVRLTMDVAPETMRLENGVVVGEAWGGGVTFTDRRPEVSRQIQLLINLPRREKGEEFAKLRPAAQGDLQRFYQNTVVNVEVFLGRLPGQIELVLNPLPGHGKVRPQCRVITLLAEPLVGWKLRWVELTKPFRRGQGFKYLSVFEGQVTLLAVSDDRNPVWFNELIVLDPGEFGQPTQLLAVRGKIADSVGLQQVVYQLAFDEEVEAEAPVEVVELPINNAAARRQRESAS